MDIAYKPPQEQANPSWWHDVVFEVEDLLTGAGILSIMWQLYWPGWNEIDRMVFHWAYKIQQLIGG